MEQNLDLNKLNVLDIYFDNISFKQNRTPKINIKLNVKHSFKIEKSDDTHSVKLIITTIIKSNDDKIDMSLDSVGIFRVDDNKNMDERFPQIMVNTIYPYLRTQVQLITTQPGLLPIMLPLVTPLINKEPILNSINDGSIIA